VTAPSSPPANNGGMSFTELTDTIRNANKWVLAGIVLAGGLLAWWLLHGTETKAAVGASWRDRAVELLVARGYYRPTAERAVDNYLKGGYMSPEDVQLMTIVFRVMGKPVDADVSSGIGVQPSASTDYTGTEDTQPQSNGLPSSALPGEYWYIPVAPAGWASTFNGISLQFYGTTSRAEFLRQDNPGLQTTTYGKLPVGKTVKVSRT
jgi:hypothetical protein